MEFDAVLLPPRRAESVARHCSDKLALTAVRRESGEVRRFTYRELAKLTKR
jgi:cyclohexanecarboxylate-CoA ligase